MMPVSSPIADSPPAGRADDDAGQVEAAELDGGDSVVGDPVPLPHAALRRTRLLLVERGPDAFADAAAGCGVVLGVEALTPRQLAQFAAERSVSLSASASTSMFFHSLRFSQRNDLHKVG
ncbi:hypothetical protein [Streptomyces sp. NPDC101234]|uniref:hypothetical protein n=1 Tax=Streptomyces sp. NPDC101234 TaxID=3366138 RepID=UPI00380ACBB5